MFWLQNFQLSTVNYQLKYGDCYEKGVGNKKTERRP